VFEMTDLKRGEQQGDGKRGGLSHPRGGEAGENNEGAEFGTSERATRGTDRDLDRSGRSANPGHGHPREERGANSD
jgi:hypothetical protein